MGKKENTVRCTTNLIALCIALFAPVVHAQTTTLSVDGKSAYVGGSGGKFADGVIQTDVTTTWDVSADNPKAGTVSLDTWWSVPASTREIGFSTDNFGNEVDVIVDYSVPVGKTTFSMQCGLYALAPQNRLSDDYWTVVAKVGRSFTFGDNSIAFGGGAQYLGKVGKDSYPPGMEYYVSVDGSVAIGKHASLDQGIKVLYDDGVAGSDPGTIGKYRLGFSWTIGDNSFGIAEEVYTPIAGADDRETQWVTGVSYSHTFTNRGEDDNS